MIESMYQGSFLSKSAHLLGNFRRTELRKPYSGKPLTMIA